MWPSYWEHVEEHKRILRNLLGNSLELDGEHNRNNKKKSNNFMLPSPPQKIKIKIWTPFVHAYLTSLVARMFLPTYALCHFWWGMNYYGCIAKLTTKDPPIPNYKNTQKCIKIYYLLSTRFLGSPNITLENRFCNSILISVLLYLIN